MKTTIQMLYDKGLIDDFQNSDKVLKIFHLSQDLSEQVNYDIQ